MPTTTTDVRLNDLIINKLTQAEFDSIQDKSPNELYVIEGDSNLTYAEQAVELPTASADNLGRVLQYVGATDQNYTSNYFYKCISDGGNPATYSWQQVPVQDALPSQTGNSGKLLTTNGTDPSWIAADSVLDTTSTNVVQNAPVATAIGQKAGVVFRTWNDD